MFYNLTCFAVRIDIPQDELDRRVEQSIADQHAQAHPSASQCTLFLNQRREDDESIAKQYAKRRRGSKRSPRKRPRADDADVKAVSEIAFSYSNLRHQLRCKLRARSPAPWQSTAGSRTNLHCEIKSFVRYAPYC